VLPHDAHGIPASEYADTLRRRLPDYTVRFAETFEEQRRREWRRFQSFTELAGSTVTVVSLGSLGKALVHRVEGFDVDTLGVRHSPSKDGPVDEVYGYDDFIGCFPVPTSSFVAH
jgi:phosphoglycerate dehydrogenase-like enzyme